MCGILAVLCPTLPKDLQKILIQSKQLSKRGPDTSNTIIKSSGLYVFHRLAINDTSANGDQPMISEKGTVLLCNGEIYNHVELREKHNLICQSSSDCEVILRLYEKIGFVETVRQLYGVFAIILVDGNKSYFARDRIGVRPLYFGLTVENYLAVASVPNVLLHYCRGVEHFPPGMIAEHDLSKPELIFNYLQKDKIDFPLTRITNGPVVLRQTLTDAVKMRLMSDRPMGCLLSGGLDSSLVASLLVKFLGGQNVRTYSIGMDGSTDLHYARKVAQYLGTKHCEVVFTPEEGFNVIPEVIEALASYDITTVRASVGMYLLAKYIATHTDDKVIFSGEGSDELFEGYLYFHNSPSPESGEKESLRLIQNLHIYDVLRADRCISSNGLEPRVPFLDRNVVDASLALPANEKCPRKGFEKYILRTAFEGYLPDEILWRRKEAFSDGVSSVKKSWYQYIQEMVETKISDEMFNPSFPSKEAMYYKLIFDRYFPNYKLHIPYWMPMWSNSKDPSARVLNVYNAVQKNN